MTELDRLVTAYGAACIVYGGCDADHPANARLTEDMDASKAAILSHVAGIAQPAPLFVELPSGLRLAVGRLTFQSTAYRGEAETAFNVGVIGMQDDYTVLSGTDALAFDAWAKRHSEKAEVPE